jgi:hypothetical protein
VLPCLSSQTPSVLLGTISSALRVYSAEGRRRWEPIGSSSLLELSAPGSLIRRPSVRPERARLPSPFLLVHALLARSIREAVSLHATKVGRLQRRAQGRPCCLLAFTSLLLTAWEGIAERSEQK